MVDGILQTTLQLGFAKKVGQGILIYGLEENYEAWIYMYDLLKLYNGN